ncbi:MULTISPECIES: hypothetical protein [Pseudomonas]|uniref:hypothetical protein n=1 Tax=Pseudomonas TaxID=286 RepID=UPI000CDBD116|nr:MULTISPECIES: hypothetical protein [Pseudomonas]AUY33417.1 hypothetical protein C3F42_09410 [Pseudomonas sp. PONIH3]MDF9755542.1 hypothetical protein [Pseudomonas hunanensis]
MARRKKIDLDRLGLELLASTIEGTQQRYADAKAEGYPVDAATISASVSLLKLLETTKAAREIDTAAELEKLREQFKRPPASQPASPALPTQNKPDDREALLAAYGLSDPTT